MILELNFKEGSRKFVEFQSSPELFYYPKRLSSRVEVSTWTSIKFKKLSNTEEGAVYYECT